MLKPVPRPIAILLISTCIFVAIFAVVELTETMVTDIKEVISREEPYTAKIETWISCGCGNMVGGESDRSGYLFQCDRCDKLWTGTEFHEKRYFGADDQNVGLYCGDKVLVYSATDFVNWAVDECQYCGMEVQTAGVPKKSERIMQIKMEADYED